MKRYYFCHDFAVNFWFQLLIEYLNLSKPLSPEGTKLPPLEWRKLFCSIGYLIYFSAKICTAVSTGGTMDHKKRAEAVVNHRLNMANSLKHRMEVARAKNDSHLLSLLEQEMRQLGLTEYC
jgi:hypothetical protein